MKLAWLGIGGNVGDVRNNMREAVGMLSGEGSEIQAVSSLYETPPWGIVDQPRFLNACVAVATEEHPRALLERLHEIEAQLARVRKVRWGPRTIDLDLLAYEGFRSSASSLAVPHPRIAERAFVVVPLAEIAPDLEIDGEPVSTLAERIERGDMKVVSAPPW